MPFDQNLKPQLQDTMKIAIIGAGNMGGATARGLAKGTIVRNEDISVSNPSRPKLDALEQAFPHIRTTQDNRECVADADLVILAVKPWKVEEVVLEIRDVLDYSKVAVASMAAGMGTETVSRCLERNDGSTLPPVYYIIPNTAIAVQQSMTFISGARTNKAMDNALLDIFNELGCAMMIEERQMNAGMALASCGIAYAMRYIRAATEGGVELGMYAHEAQQIVAQTLKGAVSLLEANHSHPEAEIDKVTTPGGITIKGLNAMERNGFSNSVIEGLKASKK